MPSTSAIRAGSRWALPGGPPRRPGLLRDEGGAALEVEVWQLPVGTLASFVLGVPPPPALGTLILADGRPLRGFVVESHAVRDALDMTQFGGWRRFLADQPAP